MGHRQRLKHVCKTFISSLHVATATTSNKQIRRGAECRHVCGLPFIYRQRGVVVKKVGRGRKFQVSVIGYIWVLNDLILPL